ncbi:EamA family transporter [Sinorhizobium medicae]|nr:EamA family transporter [Sinorhizobium medicae]MDX0474674.1 EamA family transporter [Sinorhizobium medicae]
MSTASVHAFPPMPFPIRSGWRCCRLCFSSAGLSPGAASSPSPGMSTVWWRGLIGGAGSIGSYGLALWAMTKAPVATVAALRETAILFAVVISVVFLKERVSAWRIIAACIIALGALLLRLA